MPHLLMGAADYSVLDRLDPGILARCVYAVPRADSRLWPGQDESPLNVHVLPKMTRPPADGFRPKDILQYGAAGHGFWRPRCSLRPHPARPGDTHETGWQACDGKWSWASV
jgi:hypothetical protein